jgi:nucleoside-diphosphate-sugar epimerase
MKVVIIGNTSMIAKRIRSQFDGLATVLMAGRSAEAEVRFGLDEDYAFDERIGRTDAIVHCAASFGGNEMESATQNELVNAAGAFRVAQLARDTKCAHLIYVASTAIYDHPQNEYFGSYGLSKRHGQENLDWACRQLGVHFTALVVSQVYDEFGEARKHQPLFYRVIDAARKGGDVTFYGEVDPERNLLFVGDLAEIVRRVIQLRITGIHPAVHPKSNRLSEIAETAFQVFGNGGKVIFRKDMPNIPTIYVPARTDLYERIEYAPQTGLSVGIGMIKKNLR